MSRKRQASDKVEVDPVVSDSGPSIDSSSNPTAPTNPKNRHQRSRLSSSLSHPNFLQALSGLQSVPRSRQGPLKYQLLSSESFVKRLEQQKPLEGHHGCVNTISWDETGEYLLTGSDDLFLNIYRPLDPKPLVHSIPSGHPANIFSAKFMYNSSATKIISCCANGVTRLTDVNQYVERSGRGDWMPVLKFECHRAMSMTYEVMPDMISSHVFYDCSEDGKINRYDTRVRTSCDCDGLETCDKHSFININSHLRPPPISNLSSHRIFYAFGRGRAEIGVSAITQRPENPNYIAAACGDDTVRIYDCRNVSSGGDHRSAQVYSFSPYVPSGWVVDKDGDLVQGGQNRARSHISTRITSLKYDPCRSGQLLASYSRGDCYLIDPTGMATGISMGSSKYGSSTNSGGKAIDVKGKQRHNSDTGSDVGKPPTKKKSGPKLSESNDSVTLSGPVAKKKEERDVVKEKKEEEGEKERIGKGKGKEKKEEGSKLATLFVRPETTEETLDDTEEESETNDEDSNVDNDEDMDDALQFEFGFAMDDSDNEDDDDDDDDDPSAMDTDLNSESDSESDLQKDVKEYWIRRSFYSGKSDIVQVYSGHRNAKTMIKEANFYGPNSEYIMSGSDDGRIFIWGKKTGKILNVIKGDEVVINCLQPHPFSHFLLAASGIDHTTKIFMPTADEPVNLSKIRGIKKPTANAYELKPATAITESTPEGQQSGDEIDQEKAYFDSRSDSDSYSSLDSDDSNDIDDDFIFGNPQLLQIFRQLIQRREQLGSNVERNSEADADE